MMGVMMQTAFLVAAILAVQKIFGQRLHAYVRYGLWLLVVFRLLVPVNLIDSPYSMLRFAEPVVQYENGIDDIIVDGITADDGTAAVLNGKSADLMESSSDAIRAYLQAEEIKDHLVSKVEQLQAGGDMQVSEAEQTGKNLQTNDTGKPGNGLLIDGTGRVVGSRLLDGIGYMGNALPIKNIVQAVWLIGSLTVGAFLGISHFRFRRRLRRTRVAYVQDKQQDKPAEIRRRQVPIYRVKGLDSPCLVGFFGPIIYIGADIDTDSDTFRYTIAHEKTHYLHRDYIWAFVRAVLVTVYWFHPFVWIAAAASVKDGEIACDYGTVRRIGEKERYAYSEMLLTFSCGKKEKRVYSYGTMLRPGSSELKERILRLTKANDNRVWAGILAAVVMVVLAGCAFTGVSERG